MPMEHVLAALRVALDADLHKIRLSEDRVETAFFEQGRPKPEGRGFHCCRGHVHVPPLCLVEPMIPERQWLPIP
jgi:hypothetical protein